MTHVYAVFRISAEEMILGLAASNSAQCGVLTGLERGTVVTRWNDHIRQRGIMQLYLCWKPRFACSGSDQMGAPECLDSRSGHQYIAR